MRSTFVLKYELKSHDMKLSWIISKILQEFGVLPINVLLSPQFYKGFIQDAFQWQKQKKQVLTT